MLSGASLRARLLAASLAMALAGLVAADIATYLALRSFLIGQAEQALDDAAGTVEHAISPDGRIDADDLVAADEGGLLAPGMYVERRGPDGAVMTLGGRAHARPRLPDPLPRPAGGATHVTFRAPNLEPGRADVLVRVQSNGPGAVIALARSLEDIEHTLGRLVAIEIGATVVLTVILAAAGAQLVRRALRPLDDIGRTAAAIAGGDLARRIDRTDRRSEVGRLGSALNDMLQQIEAAFAARARSEERLRRFVADASHELRTPIAAVAAYAELSERARASHPGDLPRLLRRIRRESQRMGALVADLLLLSRLDQGRPLERQPVDLGLVASDAVDTARALDPTRPITLTVAGLVEVSGDRARLRQVVDNLLGNARVHTPPDTAIAVDVHADDGTGRARLRVVDHGPGFDDELAERAFERFYRADASRARAGGPGPDGPGRAAGTGLGLAIARSIAEAHDGTVTITPTPGGGATLTVALPLLDPDPRPAGPQGSERAGAGDDASGPTGRASSQTIAAT